MVYFKYKEREGKNMNIYTIILITICILRIGFSLGEHGETEVIQHDFRETLIGQLIAIFLVLKATSII